MEVFIGAGIASLIMYTAAKRNPTDRYKLKCIFENLNYKKGNRSPTLIKRTKRSNYTEYVYSVPFGLIDDERLLPVIQKTLNKYVEIKFAGKLVINVYDNKLPRFVAYDWNKTKPWIVPVGVTHKGMVYHNFDHIPHMTIAGTTRYGKTVLLKLILAHLINNNEDVEFYILDLKGGLEFGQYRNLKQVKEVTRDIADAKKCLSSISKQMDKDMKYFEDKIYNNITKTNINRRSFIIVDEGAELDKDCQEYLSRVARIGGALGYRLVFATQYPTADTLPRQVKQNADAKISFRLPTEVASRVAIDESGAEQVDNVGKAIYRTADRQIIQVPYITDKEIASKLRRHQDDPTKKEDKKRRENPVTFG